MTIVDPPPEGPELFFGLAGAVGTDLQMVADVLAELLEDRRYRTCEPVQLSVLLDLVDWSRRPDVAPTIDDDTTETHIATRMEAGDRLRETLDRGDAMALLAVMAITRLRDDPQEPIPRTAFIFKSLKHPKEVDTLREVYGPNFFLISAYSPVGTRAQNLERKITDEWNRKAYTPSDKSAPGVAQNLIHRDVREAGRDLGQRLGDTFAKADLFVDARDRGRLRSELERFIELLFDHPFHTPTQHENAMFHAAASALRSSAPGRQVGAAVTTPQGDILALGTNEVPKAGGGQYWPGDVPDKRDHEHDDPDVSGSKKRMVIEQVLGRLRERGWLADTHAGASSDEFEELLAGLRIRSLIEFERAVHAEMAAISFAARRGISLQDTFLYTTTLPCHECTRHVIATGIRRVFYIEPYPKSLAEDLHPDSIDVDPDQPSSDKVAFLPFVGIAPRRYMELFTPSVDARKGEDGRVARPAAGWLPKGVPTAEPPPEDSPGTGKGEVIPLDKTPDEEGDVGESDLSEDAGVVLAPSGAAFERRSEMLYIYQEGNLLVELEQALGSADLELLDS